MTQLAESVVGIRTQRLELRPLRVTDADRLFMLINNWNVVRWLALPPWPYERTDAEAFVAANTRSTDTTDMVDRALAISHEDVLIGGIGLRRRKPSETNPARLNLGFWLGEPFWGHGYMTEAASALVRYAFATRADNIISSGALIGNDASLRVQEKLGFVPYSAQTIPSRPLGGAFPHITTMLRRGAIE